MPSRGPSSRRPLSVPLRILTAGSAAIVRFVAPFPRLPTLTGGWSLRRLARLSAPLAAIVAVAVLDLTSSSRTVLLGLVATAPLLAANLVGVPLTAAYSVLATVVAVLLGFTDHLYDDADGRHGQLVRICAVLLSGVAAVLTSRRRVAREHHLLQLTRVAEVAQH